MSQTSLARVEQIFHATMPRAPRIILAPTDDQAAACVGRLASLRGFQVVNSSFELRNLFEGPVLPEMVIVLYSSAGTHSMRYSGEHEQQKGYDFRWHWAVALNPKMHLKKVAAIEQAASSLAFTFGSENFSERFRARQLPWGSISLARSEEFDCDPMKYFRSRVSQGYTTGK